MIAIAGSAEVHPPPEGPDARDADVPGQTLSAPVITEGSALTVNAVDV
jgi:hypothetical protein